MHLLDVILGEETGRNVTETLVVLFWPNTRHYESHRTDSRFPKRDIFRAEKGIALASCDTRGPVSRRTRILFVDRPFFALEIHQPTHASMTYLSDG